MALISRFAAAISCPDRQTVAENERARAAQIGGDAAHGFLKAAELFERLAERCLEMTRAPGS